MKTVLFEQFFGAGDILFAQSIAHDFIDRGYNVIWPVADHYYEGFKRAYPQITFIPQSIVKPELFDIKEKIEVGGIEMAPIRWSDSYMKKPYRFVMSCKYEMYDLDWRIWKNHAMWEIQPEKCFSLMNHLGIKNGDKYNFINKRFGTNAERSVDIQVTNDFKNIEMTEIEGYSLFDWTMVLSHATEIHTVSTSLLFMMEMLPLNQPIHLYCRKPIEQDFNFVSFLFTKPYILHQ